MSDENEFQQSEEIDDLEFLKSFKPEWQNDRLEPLTPLPEETITQPRWGKADLSDSTTPSTTPNTGQNFQLVPVIAGMEDGSTFTPGIVNAIGPFTPL